MALRYTVERIGCEVVDTVDTGEDAIRQTAMHRPDLVLMDTRLRTPMSGVEAANLIWERQRVPSLFISAYTAEELETHYHGPGHFVLLGKPVLDGDLERAVRQVFEAPG